MKERGKNKEGGEEKEMKCDRKEQKNDGERYVSIILMSSLHCKRCAMKVIRAMKKAEGVEEATVDESNTRLHIIGKVGMDPSVIIMKLEALTRRKATLVSFNTHEAKCEQEEEGNDGNEDGRRGQAMVVLKIGLHCNGCTREVKEKVLEFEGVEGVGMDFERNVLVLKGSMDVENVVVFVGKVLRRKVKVLAITEEEEGMDGDGDEDREGEGEKGRVGTEVKKSEHDVGEGKKVEVEVGGGFMVRESKVSGKEEGGDGDYGGLHNAHLPYKHHSGMRYAPSAFSEENPNGCFVM